MGTLDYGWTHIEQSTANAMLLASRLWKLNIQWDLSELINDLTGDQHIGQDLGIISRTITLMETFFKNETDVETFIARAQSLNTGGTSTVSIQIKTDGSKFDFFQGQSVTNTIEMLFTNIQGLQKVANENGTVYKIDLIQMRQAG